ncbi:glycerophosphodiester phosphodiesterase [Brumicola pallidula]|uniref:glycerophosphodiester phosphodiesterase n=1 Tax=Brumicola pallidula DSM 14239 = ACAM 615 TaxID=1121922 RepID=K6ZI58_9ALTE|nr:glycerophosphodiester phosphodiesterase [Glaciecola pallidula]GAC28578.1 glycerophosphoryl diester phosphodiesterase [Glaciecola pallidula DSM 14239 = ACAM 615]
MSLHNVFLKSFMSFLFVVISMQIDADQRTSTGISEESAGFTIIAHRGASGYLPEHTIDAATLAFMQGANYIEQDIILTSDDVPIVLHDIHIETVTNVESIFPERHRSDGRYYAIDFTWAEIQQLFVHEREDQLGNKVFPTRYSGRGAFKVASFEQHIELINKLNNTFSKSVGYYSEIKSPEWHLSEGKDITKIVVNMLEKHGLTQAHANIFIQCFYPETLKRLKNEFKVKVALVQLIADNSWNESSADYDIMQTKQGLEEVATYANVIGPWLPQIYDPVSETETALVRNAKALGLIIHPYTFRADDLAFNMSPETLIDLVKNKLKLDGIFTDQVDIVLEEVNKIESKASDYNLAN